MNILNKFNFLTLFCVVLMLLPELVNAQYFGRNKVQYEDFDFEVLHSPNFNIYYYPRSEKAVTQLATLSERWYGRHAQVFGYTFADDNPLVLYANHADFQQNDIVPNVGVGTGGVTEGLRKRVIMPLAESNSSTNHVLGHELVHVFQYRLASNLGGIRATANIPLWFIEGMAEYLSIGTEDTQTEMWMRDAVLYDNLPSVNDLRNSREYFPYRYGHALWTFMTGTWGDQIVFPLYSAVAQKGVNNALQDTLNISADSLSGLWHDALVSTYGEEVEQATPPDEIGEPVFDDDDDILRTAPSISPDGEYVVYVSNEKLFSLEWYLADVETGEVIRSLTNTLTDPHLNALRFIESSGSWSPEGERFATVVFKKGDNQLIIIDPDNGNITQEFRFDEAEAMTNPAWSPDGNRIVFSGSRDGFSDLWMYDLKQDSLQQLTEDAYSDLHPAWSPDGGTIAFISERGPDTDLENLDFGEMVITLMDVESREITVLPPFQGAKHINPIFSPDGNSLYFISDRGGVNNIFRYDFQDEDYYQVTDVSTGVSGISSYSPALTMGRDSGRMIFTTFSQSSYLFRTLQVDDADGVPVDRAGPVAEAGKLPPANRRGQQAVSELLAEGRQEVLPDTAITRTDYRPKLGLEFITGGGGVGVSNQLGVAAAGGLFMQFSDMLNQHQLMTSLRLQGSYKDIGGQVAYLNQDNRFIWGASVSHIPFRTSRAFFTQDTTTIDGTEVVANALNQVNRRIYNDRISLLGFYPFSTTQRLESSIGFTHIWSDIEVVTTLFDRVGNAFDRDVEELETPSPLNLFNVSLAYVQDSSVPALTGPVAGQRFRLEVTPTRGTLNYVSTITDYRRYVFFNPLTLAFRGLHIGRYGEDANDDRLSPNFLGFESIMRGYNFASFEPGECTRLPDGNNGCAEFNRLLGSSMAVANLELRYPLLGPDEFALFSTRTIPTTLTTFFDGGVSWTPNDLPELKWETRSTERIPVFSAGVSVRVNILGYLITELYYAVPFQRPEKGGYVGFHISPGW
ncbi:BamA/TamA family outer membrane protein [Rhodohalobacter mucosus]|nr:BamA/TamA family outer membrane protein [Rhodohalobacter mucosus]